MQLDPRHARAWYNLGLARDALGGVAEADTALAAAEAAAPRDPQIAYACATVLAKLGRIEEARAAAVRALHLGYDPAAIRDLMEALRQ